ncbi:MAG: prepilin-type N-terminal cleavage/methylation domain-containing protein [Candidatus Omnitrophica bacterium]|nr:prepilin-type N-terminal cleavage/methylation domain-containing protein [Candidatus Omnitrophota bacterium]
MRIKLKAARNNNNGFTLIEIIVVLIILGGLAAIALPSYFSWVDQSHTAEAVFNLKTFADQMDACLVTGKDSSTCGTQLLGATNDNSMSPTGGGQLHGFRDVGTDSNYFQYGIATIDNQKYYLLVARWNISLNSRSNLSPQVLTCANQVNLGVTTNTPTFGLIGICGDGQTRVMLSSGVFDGMYGNNAARKMM